MSARTSRVAGMLLTASALWVGGWAALGPRSFYDGFPGLGSAWVSTDGPYNEHLVRDVGGLYLGLAVAGILMLLRRDGHTTTVVGAAWTCVSVLHLAYHLSHLRTLMTLADKAAETASLTLVLLLALSLLLQPASVATTPLERTR